jgi:hypothetical protein
VSHHGEFQGAFCFLSRCVCISIVLASKGRERRTTCHWIQQTDLPAQQLIPPSMTLFVLLQYIIGTRDFLINSRTCPSFNLRFRTREKIICYGEDPQYLNSGDERRANLDLDWYIRSSIKPAQSSLCSLRNVLWKNPQECTI